MQEMVGREAGLLSQRASALSSSRVRVRARVLGRRVSALYIVAACVLLDA